MKGTTGISKMDIDGRLISIGKNLTVPYTPRALWKGKQVRLGISKDGISDRWYAH